MEAIGVDPIPIIAPINTPNNPVAIICAHPMGEPNLSRVNTVVTAAPIELPIKAFCKYSLSFWVINHEFYIVFSNGG